MSQGNRSRRSRTSPKQPGGVQIALRFLAISAVLSLLLVAGTLVYRNLTQRGQPVQVNVAVSPALNPVEALYLNAYLALNNEALGTPARNDTFQVIFEIRAGEDATTVGNNLVAAALINDATLFSNYLRYYGLDRQLEAGVYELAPSMTIPEIAYVLTAGIPAEITVQIIEGWRREQIAEWLDQQPNLPFGSVEFLSATGPGERPPAELGIDSDIPPGSALEGFLFPDTYNLPLDASAEELVMRMLENYSGKVTQQMRTDAAAQGLTMYQVLTVASIVEREARVPDERPSIASVYLNRLAAGMKLEADPTVQYAMGYQPDTGQWWNLALTQADYYAVDSPYNTYLYSGLPPGPIANPGLGSITAVIYPADTPFFFFRAACDGSGRHLFAVTFEEHVANACQ